MKKIYLIYIVAGFLGLMIGVFGGELILIRMSEPVSPLPVPAELPPKPVKIVEPPATKAAPTPKKEIPVVKLPDYVGTEVTYENIFNGLNKERYNYFAPYVTDGIFKLDEVLLVHDKDLDAIAQLRVNDMFEYNYFAHKNQKTGMDWDDFWFGDALRVKWRGEILARDYRTIYENIAAWIASPTHNKVMFDPRYTRVGIAMRAGKVAVELATPFDPEVEVK